MFKILKKTKKTNQLFQNSGVVFINFDEPRGNYKAVNPIIKALICPQ